MADSIDVLERLDALNQKLQASLVTIPDSLKATQLLEQSHYLALEQKCGKHALDSKALFYNRFRASKPQSEEGVRASF